MNYTEPEDWVLLEAARRFEWPSLPVQAARVYFKDPIYIGFRALCDMIAKHEQPPVDPDVEAVKRIIAHYFHCDAVFVGGDDRLARAVAQYKLEREK